MCCTTVQCISYLCTYDLYGPVRNAFDVVSIHYEGKWEWLSNITALVPPPSPHPELIRNQQETVRCIKERSGP